VNAVPVSAMRCFVISQRTPTSSDATSMPIDVT
jgi:hypothetical protein